MSPKLKLQALLLFSVLTLTASTSFAMLAAVVAPSMMGTRSIETIEGIERTGSPIIATTIATPKLNYQAGANLMSIETLMTMTPEKYRQMTGKRMGLIKSLELKIVQRQMRKHGAADSGSGFPKWAYIVFALLALGWLAIGIRSDFKGNDWWISLLLYLLFYLPGLIYTLVVMKKYY